MTLWRSERAEVSVMVLMKKTYAFPASSSNAPGNSNTREKECGRLRDGLCVKDGKYRIQGERIITGPQLKILWTCRSGIKVPGKTRGTREHGTGVLGKRLIIRKEQAVFPIAAIEHSRVGWIRVRSRKCIENLNGLSAIEWSRNESIQRDDECGWIDTGRGIDIQGT